MTATTPASTLTAAQRLAPLRRLLWRIEADGLPAKTIGANLDHGKLEVVVTTDDDLSRWLDALDLDRLESSERIVCDGTYVARLASRLLGDTAPVTVRLFRPATDDERARLGGRAAGLDGAS